MLGSGRWVRRWCPLVNRIFIFAVLGLFPPRGLTPHADTQTASLTLSAILVNGFPKKTLQLPWISRVTLLLQRTQVARVRRSVPRCPDWLSVNAAVFLFVELSRFFLMRLIWPWTFDWTALKFVITEVVQFSAYHFQRSVLMSILKLETRRRDGTALRMQNSSRVLYFSTAEHFPDRFLSSIVTIQPWHL